MSPNSPDDAPDLLLGSLLEQNIPGLEAALASGWDINRPIRITEHSWMTPVNIALSHKKDRLLDFLLERKVDLNPKLDPALIWAIDNGCSVRTLEKLISQGATLKGVNQVGTNAYLAAIYADRLELLPEILRLGLPVDADGGVALRSAVFNRKFEAVKFLVEHGHDVNARTPDMVFPNNPSALAVAARDGDFETVKYLIEHGADVTLADEYGNRPYTEALKQKHTAITDYLKHLEPPEWHDAAYHLQRIAGYNLPPSLLELLQRSDRRIELGDDGPKYIEFHSLLHVKEITWKGEKLLDLLAEVDDFWEVGYLVWSVRQRKVANADYEHDRFTVLCEWDKFIENPRKWLDRLAS